MSHKRVLILTLTAGGGHLQAARAKRHEIRASSPDAFILEQDLFFDWMGKWFGTIVKHLWGGAQSRGNVVFLVYLSGCMRLANYVLWLPIFLGTVRICLKHSIDTIIDTQPTGTSAIVKALRFIHWWKGKTIILEKVLTDLPTKDASHFFSSFQKLSKKDHPYVKLLTTEPLLESGESEADFWEKHCRLPMTSIIYAKLPLRPAFFDPPKDLDSLDISIPTPGDLHMTHKILSYGPCEVKRYKDYISVSIQPQDKITTLMLGANPNPSVILAYTSAFIRILNQGAQNDGRKDLLFIFCNSQISEPSSLKSLLLRLLQKTKQYPKNLTLIPIPHQNDLVVASLFHRSNATITKSGGLTSMELLTTCNGTVWIHQEPPKSVHQGMPLWEHGNARYLIERKWAKLITPESFETLSASYFMPDPAEEPSIPPPLSMKT